MTKYFSDPYWNTFYKKNYFLRNISKLEKHLKEVKNFPSFQIRRKLDLVFSSSDTWKILSVGAPNYIHDKWFHSVVHYNSLHIQSVKCSLHTIHYTLTFLRQRFQSKNLALESIIIVYTLEYNSDQPGIEFFNNWV